MPKLIAALSILAAVGNAAASVTYEYTGEISRIADNLTGQPIAVGTPVSISFTFDPLTPNTPVSSGSGSYVFSGGDTDFRMTVGAFASTPRNAFAVSVFPENCCAISDGYQFLDVPGNLSRGLSLSFPGWLAEARASFKFFERTPAVVSTALFTSQPNPADYLESTLVITDRSNSSNLRLFITLKPAGPRVPEPTSLFLVGSGLLVLSTSGCGRFCQQRQ